MINRYVSIAFLIVLWAVLKPFIFRSPKNEVPVAELQTQSEFKRLITPEMLDRFLRTDLEHPTGDLLLKNPFVSQQTYKAAQATAASGSAMRLNLSKYRIAGMIRGKVVTLQDGAGKRHILKPGMEFEGAVVIEVGAGSVLFKDAQGSFSLGG
jgi:hypothetical protein